MKELLEYYDLLKTVYDITFDDYKSVLEFKERKQEGKTIFCTRHPVLRVYFDAESMYVFDNNGLVVGKIENDNIVELSNIDLKDCVERGIEYKQ